MYRIINSGIIIFLLLVSAAMYSQTFITIDKDTYEFIEDVTYLLYNKKQVVYNGITSNDKPTTLKPDVQFDSIVFSRVDYEALGLIKSRIDSVNFLSKKTVYLDEIVLGNNADKEVILGETNRFIKKHTRTLSKNLDCGLLFLNGSAQKLKLNKLAFYVNKVKFKTAYRVNFMQVTERWEREGHQFAEPGELVYATDILYLEPKEKGKIEVTLPESLYLPATEKVFVWIELIDYYDKDGAILSMPEIKDQTKLKFQLSKQENYYSRLFDANSHELTDVIVNINTWLINDFLRTFNKPIHKSNLVAPAILLYGQKM